ncbi:MAG: EVE domain-containing protein [Dehalococcoidales bacterium]|nr:EVE domain-containing protein [Dehalococcoidales bacterium]
MVTYRMIVTTPDNFEVNKKRNFDIDGFNNRCKKEVEEIQPGDKFIYYVTKIQKIGAISEATSNGYFDNKTKIWTEEDEMWPYRFNIKPLLVLDEAQMLNVNKLITKLSFITKKQRETSWALAFHQSLRKISKEDFELVESEMRKTNPGQPVVINLSKPVIIEPLTRSTSTHKEIVEVMENIGKCLGMIVEREQKIAEYRHDMVWKKKQFLAPSVVIEVCDSGSLEKDILSLGWASENLEAKTILVLVKDNDYYQAKRRLPASSKIVVVKADSIKILGDLVQTDAELLKAIFQ